MATSSNGLLICTWLAAADQLRHAFHLRLRKISLFAFDLVMAVGHATDAKWVHDGMVYQGGYCTAQGESLKPLVTIIQVR